MIKVASWTWDNSAMIPVTRSFGVITCLKAKTRFFRFIPANTRPNEPQFRRSSKLQSRKSRVTSVVSFEIFRTWPSEIRQSHNLRYVKHERFAVESGDKPRRKRAKWVRLWHFCTDCEIIWRSNGRLQRLRWVIFGSTPGNKSTVELKEVSIGNSFKIRAES